MLRALLATSLAATSAPASNGLAEIKNETLLVPVPDGFKIGATSSAKSEAVVDFIPSGEDMGKWTQRVTERVVRGMKSIDPDQMPAATAKSWAASCPSGTSQRLVSDQEHGYAISLWQFTCPSNNGSPGAMWFKSISGSDNWYGVQFAYRGAPTREMVPVTMAYLKRVMVCDTRRSDRSCPTSKK